MSPDDGQDYLLYTNLQFLPLKLFDDGGLLLWFVALLWTSWRREALLWHKLSPSAYPWHFMSPLTHTSFNHIKQISYFTKTSLIFMWLTFRIYLWSILLAKWICPILREVNCGCKFCTQISLNVFDLIENIVENKKDFISIPSPNSPHCSIINLKIPAIKYRNTGITSDISVAAIQ